MIADSGFNPPPHAAIPRSCINKAVRSPKESPAEGGALMPYAGTLLFYQEHSAAEERHTQVTASTSAAPENERVAACTASLAPWPISRPLPGVFDKHRTGTQCATLRVLWLYFYACRKKMQASMRTICVRFLINIKRAALCECLQQLCTGSKHCNASQ